MQQFKTLWIKELRSYFSGYLAYFLIFIYLFASVGCAFYFKGFLSAKDGALFSLFALQPYILAMLIPAVTMKLWAEEYKSNTAETLLTLPVSLNKIIGAKFCACAGFAGALSLGLLPFVFYAAFWLHLDWLNIICAFLGLDLLIILFCALGTAISSLSKNLLMTYVLSIFSLILWCVLPATKLIPTYQNFLFGEVGIFDFFYFVSFAFLFLYLNKMVIEYRRNMQKNSKSLMAVMMGAALVANALICWGVGTIDYKFDLTAGRIYSLSSPSKKIIEKIKTPTQINLYISEDYLLKDYAVTGYFEQVSRFLKKYQRASNGLIKLNVQKIRAFSEEEKVVSEKDIYTETNENGSKNYFGAVIENQDGYEETIGRFLPERQSYLEEDIDRALLKTNFPELKRSVGVYLDAEQNLDDYEGVALIMENEYNTAVVDNATYQIRQNADAIMLINPKGLSPVLMYALDQYLVKGGNLIIFLDRHSQNQLDNINDESMSILKLLKHWQIEVGNTEFNQGEVAEQFNDSSYPLVIDSASAIKVNNEDLMVTPLITNGKNMLGLIAEGEFTSIYNNNPFAETNIGKFMKKFKHKSRRGRLAVIGDADILDENNWIAENSPDRDVYGALEKASNGRFFRALVDYMTGDYIYSMLPKRPNTENILTVSDSIEHKIQNRTAKQYAELKEEADSLVPLIWQIADFNEDNVPMVMDLTDIGRTFQSLNDRINAIEYSRTAEYNHTVRKMMVWLIFILPLAEMISALIIFGVLLRRRNKKIKELLK